MLIADTPVGFDATAEPVQAGPARLFIGERSDPFFADAEGALHGFQWTGQSRRAFLTNGKVTSDGLAPHADLLTDFPFLFLGPPNP